MARLKFVILSMVFLASGVALAGTTSRLFQLQPGKMIPADGVCVAYDAEGYCTEYSDGSVCVAYTASGACSEWTGGSSGTVVCVAYDAQGACTEYSDGSVCVAFDANGNCTEWTN